jgi:hypothetical protein
MYKPAWKKCEAWLRRMKNVKYMDTYIMLVDIRFSTVR